MDKWTRKYLKLARVLAEDNDSCYSRQIGVVLVSKHNRIISLGYNGSVEGAPHNDDPRYLDHLWSILEDEDRLKLTNDGIKTKNEFVAKYSGCKTCPRRILNIPSGQKLHYCNCLSYDSKILVDNEWSNIGQVVNQKRLGKVLSYNETTKTLEQKSILNWFKIPYNGKYYKIVTKYNKHGKNGPMGGSFTPDHKFLTPSGWKMLSELRPGDRIASTQMDLSYVQKQIVLGSLLGDSSIFVTNKNSARYSCLHCKAQKDYLLFKNELLRSISHSGVKKVLYPKTPPGSNKTYNEEQFLIRTKTLSCLKYYRDLCYQGGSKSINTTWLDELDALGLCVYYLDDGSLYDDRNAVFSMNGFNTSSKSIFMDWMKAKFGLECNLCSDGNRIILNKEYTTKLHAIIKDYVPKCMQYKIIPALRTGHDPDINGIMDKDDSSIFYDEVINIVEVNNKTLKRHSFCYCIEVEDNHNFMTVNALVKNCAHAERNALAAANKHGVSTQDSTMYCYCQVPCHECTIQIIQAGVKKVVCLDNGHPLYSPSSPGLFKMSGVVLEIVNPNDIDKRD